MSKVSFGMKCPHGHEKVQMVIGGTPKCSVCGEVMVTNDAAESVGVHRTCKNCGSHTSVLLIDSKQCPDCGKPWS